MRAAITPPKVVVGILTERDPGEMTPSRVILLSDSSGIEAAKFDPRCVTLDELGCVNVQGHLRFARGSAWRQSSFISESSMHPMPTTVPPVASCP